MANSELSRFELQKRLYTLVDEGRSVKDAACTLGLTPRTAYRWLQDKPPSMEDCLQKLRRLQAENARLRRAIMQLDEEVSALRRSPAKQAPCSTRALN